jgi:hypothetical protein
MKQRFYKLSIFFTITVIATLLTNAEQLSKKQPAFKIRGVHQFLYPSLQQKLNPGKPVFEQFNQRLKLLAKLDYNLVIFGMGNAYRTLLTVSTDGKVIIHGGTANDLRKLIKQAIKLNIEPVFGMKFIGKPNAMMKELGNKYPGLLVNPKSKNTIIDPTFKLPGVSSSYSGTYLKVIDFLTALYPKNHPPKYFLLGIDEFISSEMAMVAKKMQLSPPEAFAYCLDISTTHLLNKGITPIIWGDSLLSPTLGKTDHGITLPSYKPDPRLKLELGHSYYSTFKSKDYQLHQMVNFMQNRDKIIVADWHYRSSPTGEFPSVDYFQQVGFKDVWGATWNNMTNIQQFSRYAKKRQCGGMLATTWNNYAINDQLKIKQILYNCSAYFHNPLLPLPHSIPKFTITNQAGKELVNSSSTGLITVHNKKLYFNATIQPQISPKKMELLIISNSQKKQFRLPLNFNRKKQLTGYFSIPANIIPPTRLRIEYGLVNANNELYYLYEGVAGFEYGKHKKIASSAPAKSLLYINFSQAKQTNLNKLWASGKCSTPLTTQPKQGTAPILANGGINSSSVNGIWTEPVINNFITKGFKLKIAAKMTGKFKGNSFCALLTQGNFYHGFRILIRKDQKLLFQFGGLGDNKPLWIWAEKPFPMNKWTNLEFTYIAPDSTKQGSLTIKIAGKYAGTTPLPKSMIIDNKSLLGIGCEPNGQPRAGKKLPMRRPNFPGLIKSVTISPIK